MCAWEHILDDFKKKLDAKSHAYIMMAYSKELKAYQLFNPVKQHIIIKCNVIFDETNSSMGLLKSSSSLSYNDPIGIVEDNRSTIYFMSIRTSPSTSIPKSVGSQSTPIETITSLDQSFEGNGTLPRPCLSWWVVNMIEVFGSNVGNISTG